MKSENTEKIRERVIELIESEFESDAAFERALELPEKTVNNWRRGRSSSFMKMLPTLSSRFGINIGVLMDIPLRRDTSELSDDELKLLHLYRRSRALPQKLRAALRENLEGTINLYISSYQDIKEKYAKKNGSQEKK